MRLFKETAFATLILDIARVRPERGYRVGLKQWCQLVVFRERPLRLLSRACGELRPRSMLRRPHDYDRDLRPAVPRRGIARLVQSSSLGSTHHERFLDCEPANPPDRFAGRQPAGSAPSHHRPHGRFLPWRFSRQPAAGKNDAQRRRRQSFTRGDIENITSASEPPPHLPNIVIIGRSELAAHFGFFKGDVNPVGRCENGKRHNEHRPGA